MEDTAEPEMNRVEQERGPRRQKKNFHRIQKYQGQGR